MFPSRPRALASSARLILAALTSAFLAACSSASEPRYFEPHGVVNVSPEFDAQQTETVLGAIAAWRDATGGEVDLQAQIGTASPRIRPAQQRERVVAEFVPSAEPEIVIDTAKTPYAWELRNTTLHELGHALGLQHIERVESVMFPYANSVQQLDRWTLEAWHQLRTREP